MIDVTLLGTGGMMPLPGRALTALYVRVGGSALLIDCGEGTQTAIRAAGLRFKPIEAILITHFHADHISGLPGLLLTIGNEGRTAPLSLYGPAGLEEIVRALRVIVPELPFALEFHALSAEEPTRFSCIGLTVEAFGLEHRIPCLGYCMRLPRAGRFDPQAARERGIPVQLWSRLQKGETVNGVRSGEVLGTPRKGLKLLYATDTRPVPAIERFGADADLLVLEGMFGEPEKQARVEETRHMMMQEAAQIAQRAGAKALWLTHYSPATPEPALYEAALRQIFPYTVTAADGQTTTLRYRD